MKFETPDTLKLSDVTQQKQIVEEVEIKVSLEPPLSPTILSEPADSNQETIIAATWMIKIVAFAERINDVISIGDYFVLLLSMTVYDLVCEFNMSQEMELALQQAVLITMIHLL
jgi:hypothetical protein